MITLLRMQNFKYVYPTGSIKVGIGKKAHNMIGAGKIVKVLGEVLCIAPMKLHGCLD
jgi:hypothetical protein